MRFVPFGCIQHRLFASKLGVKQAELVQKFVPRSRFGIFRNERTRSTPLDRNIMFIAFHSVLVPLGMFCYDSKLGAKWAKLVQVMQKFVPQSRVGSFRKERTQSTPLDPELMFCCASLCLDAFGSISLLL